MKPQAGTPNRTPTEPTASEPLPTPVEELVSLCRTAVGDSLRSIIHFTRSESELLYLRADLHGNDRRRALEVKASLVESERVGFSAREQREHHDPHVAGAGSDPLLGEYEFTVRVFTDGFVCRIIVDEHGLLLTADDLDVGQVEDVAIALRGLLAVAYG